MKRVLCLGLLLLLTACGINTAAVNATPSPVFARYQASDVSRTFLEAGLRVDGPYPAPPTMWPAPPPTIGTASNLWQPDRLHGYYPMMLVVVVNQLADLSAWQRYFGQYQQFSFYIFRYLIRHNVMLVFLDQTDPAVSVRLPDYGPFWAVFAALP